MGLTIAYNSQAAMPNCEAVELFNPARPGVGYPVANANRNDMGIRNTDVMALRAEESTVSWTVGLDEIEACGCGDPREDWWLVDSSGARYVIDRVAKSVALRFYRLHTTARPNLSP